MRPRARHGRDRPRGPLALVRAASPLPLDPVDDHATCAERLGECHGLLLDMLRGMRPLAGGVRPRIERLLVAHGVLDADEADGDEARAA